MIFENKTVWTDENLGKWRRSNQNPKKDYLQEIVMRKVIGVKASKTSSRNFGRAKMEFGREELCKN